MSKVTQWCINRRNLWLAVAGILSCLCLEAQAQHGRKVFGGKVLEVHAKEHWFLMNGGASRKYSRVRIDVAQATRWSGVPLKGRPLRPGEPIQVLATPGKDGAFRALAIEVLDPNAKPGGNGK